jgi:hypothetical protein
MRLPQFASHVSDRPWAAEVDHPKGGAVTDRRWRKPQPRAVVTAGVAERDFDFWAGVWECAWDGGTGRNTIEWVCGGRVLRESFDAAEHGLVGTSISVYDASSGRWVQTWMDSQGSWFHLTGGMRDGAMELLTTTADEQGHRKRMRFAGIGPDGFDWTWSRTTDGTAWEPLWSITYSRIG